jgi:hypothetical protein
MYWCRCIVGVDVHIRSSSDNGENGAKAIDDIDVIADLLHEGREDRESEIAIGSWISIPNMVE